MITKRKMKNKVRVTFTLPMSTLDESVAVVGDFNGWDTAANLMTHKRDGSWEAKLELVPNQNYQFRYLVNHTEWRNDPNADSYAANSFGTENSVVSTMLPPPAHAKRVRR